MQDIVHLRGCGLCFKTLLEVRGPASWMWALASVEPEYPQLCMVSRTMDGQARCAAGSWPGPRTSLELTDALAARCGHGVAPATWLWVWASVEPEYHQQTLWLQSSCQAGPALSLQIHVLPGLVSDVCNLVVCLGLS